MLKIKVYLRIVLSVAIVVSTLPYPQTAKAQDLVATEDLAGGSSVFVFRESRKKTQSRSASGRISLGAVGRAGAGRSNAQIAAAAKKRRAAAAAARKKVAIAAANRKIALSNTLTAKAEGFLDNEQTDQAITNYRDALVQNPKNARASEGLSNALTGKGIDVAGETNSDAAVVFFDEAVKLDQQNDVAYAKLGAIHDAKGQRDKAIANYEKAVAINPEYSTLYAPLGLAYLESGEIAKAEIALQKSEAGGSDTVETRFLRGLVFFKQNKNAEALAAFDAAAALDGRLAAAQYYRGQLFERMGQADEAIAAYRKSVESEPSYTPALFDLGVAYYNKGDYAGALLAYQNVIKYDNKNAQAHANLASTYRQLERFSEANAEFKQAEAGVKTADLYSEWGYSLGKTNEWDQSVAKLETAKEMSPTAIDNSNLGWGNYNAGNAKVVAKDEEGAKKNFERAKTNLQTAVEQDPKLDAAALNLGSTHNALGEFQAAVAILNIALGLRPNWVIAANQLGRGFRGLNDLINAVATFKRVVDLDGRNTFGLFSLGEAYNASGNKKEAKKINDRLKKIDPALASRLDNILSGKAVLDATKQKVQQKIPKIPRFPF